MFQIKRIQSFHPARRLSRSLSYVIAMLLIHILSTALFASTEIPYDLSEQERTNLLQEIEAMQAKLEIATRQRSNSLHEQKKMLEQQVSTLEKATSQENKELLRMAKEQLELFNRRQQNVSQSDRPEESGYRACR